MTVNGNPVDYHTIHPSLPLENGPAKTDLYSTPRYRWGPSEDSSGNQPARGAVWLGSCPAARWSLSFQWSLLPLAARSPLKQPISVQPTPFKQKERAFGFMT